MLKDLATKSYQECPNEGCGKARIKHTDYYYHGNGCIEIKYMDDSNQSSYKVKAMLEEDRLVQEISVHCFCNKC